VLRRRDKLEMTLLQKAIWAAYLKYQPRESAIPIAQFWCRDSCDHIDDASLGWSRFLRGPMDCVPIPGEHLTLFNRENARVVGPALQQRLDAVTRDARE